MRPNLRFVAFLLASDPRKSTLNLKVQVRSGAGGRP